MITIQANDIHDARTKLGLNKPEYDILIRWRRGDIRDYRISHEPGCIVDAVGFPGEDVPRSFKSGAEAILYLTGLIEKHEAFVKEDKNQRTT